MVTEVKVKVQCPNKDLCKNPDCMHYEPHEPIKHGDKPHQNCQDGVTICPLTGTFQVCR